MSNETPPAVEKTVQRLERHLAYVLENQRVARRESQIALKLHYRELARRGGPLPKFDDVEFRVFSQDGEDGILWFLFSILGTENKTTVEIGCGVGTECNSANLIVNDGWSGLLLDGDPVKADTARKFFTRHPDVRTWPPKVVQAMVTAENINSIISDAGLSGTIDLLSIDIDGNDYWIWKAIDVVSPRVVLMEFQDILGAEKAWTRPYDPAFYKGQLGELAGDYIGASLPALVKLGRTKGYRLVGCQRYGFNAFFVKNGIADQLLPEVSAASCLTHPKVCDGWKTRWPRVKDLPWVEV